MTTLKITLALLLATTWMSAKADDAPMIARGEYLARAADCVACHTTQGGKPFTGGLAFKLPFGTLYSPNITPDKATGIGNWSDDDFVNAVQKGVGKGGQHYYPAFPYTSYGLMAREDILAIKAYLFSLKPVSQPPKENQIGFPFNQRWGMFFWNLAFTPSKTFQPDPEKSAQWNRGAYLVQGPGHCGECHTPRNLAQAMSTSNSLAGAKIGNWIAYNISSDKKYGVGGWPQDVLKHYLSTGEAPGYAMAGGPMTDVIENSLKYLTPEDIHAIAVYLQNSPPRHEGIARPTPETMATNFAQSDGNELGRKLFLDSCASCHRIDGQGNQSPVATLKGLKTVNDPAGTNLLAVVLAGHDPAIFGSEHTMPGFAQNYNNEEMAALSTFVLHHFGQSGGVIKPKDVQESRDGALH